MTFEDALPREDCGDDPADDADYHGARLCAHVSGFQRLTDCIIAFEGNRQDRQNTCVSDSKFDERN